MSIEEFNEQVTELAALLVVIDRLLPGHIDQNIIDLLTGAERNKAILKLLYNSISNSQKNNRFNQI